MRCCLLAQKNSGFGSECFQQHGGILAHQHSQSGFFMVFTMHCETLSLSGILTDASSVCTQRIEAGIRLNKSRSGLPLGGSTEPLTIVLNLREPGVSALSQRCCSYSRRVCNPPSSTHQQSHLRSGRAWRPNPKEGALSPTTRRTAHDSQDSSNRATHTCCNSGRLCTDSRNGADSSQTIEVFVLMQQNA